MNAALPERTELEWTYQPSDFFEEAYSHSATEYDVVIEGGKVLVPLRVPQDPVSPQLEEHVQAYITNAFHTRLLLIPRKYELAGPCVYQHVGGRKSVEIRVSTASCIAAGGHHDVVVRDAAGNVLKDTKAERIAAHNAILDSVAAKAPRSPLLRSLLASFERSVADPANALVHLYEIPDALRKHYRGEAAARAALGIGAREWKRLGFLANDAPLEQGRHRGQHPTGRRGASEAELQEAREIVKG